MKGEKGQVASGLQQTVLVTYQDSIHSLGAEEGKRREVRFQASSWGKCSENTIYPFSSLEYHMWYYELNFYSLGLEIRLQRHSI